MRYLAAAAVTALATSGCSAAATAHESHHVGTATVVGQPDRPIAGPQGAVPQFVVECRFSHAMPDDPIVYPGESGASHLHDFFGNTTTDANSALASLTAGDTTCDQALDRAAYWAPALERNGKPLEPVKSTAYYRPGLDVDPTTVQPYPAGLVMIAGNVAATTQQPVSIVAWTCGAGIARNVAPPSCPTNRNLRMLVTFPDCWDGQRLDSDDHRDHVAYSSAGSCPADHPVPVPQLQFSVEYPVTGSTDGLALASGGLLTGHADFINAWDQDKLTSEVEHCLHRRVVCGVTSGRISG